MVLDKKWSFVLIMLIFLIGIGTVSAAENSDNLTVMEDSGDTLDTVDLIENNPLKSNDVSDFTLSSDEEEVPDVPDLNVVDKNYVYSSNINSYFKNGKLDSKYAGKTLVFSGNFENIGVLSITSDNVLITGENANLKNTVFDIEGSNVTLKGLSFDLNRNLIDNHGAVISLAGEDITLMNLDINYVVPNDVEAYVIYADGYTRYSSDNFKLINSTIYFEGHNENVDKYNCAIKLIAANSALIENNTILTSLPLKNIKYGFSGATLDSDFVYTVGIENCQDFVFNNNTIISEINKRTAVLYPTLNCLMLSKSDNALISNNEIYMTDFVTYPGIESYIYGIDIYNLNDLTVIGNKISIISTGGKLALGTAYPIQISGPISGVNITQNDLYSFSNGPNIGIYSQNFFGETELSITNNKINVTGLAGEHEWALVTGIESQDTNAEIINNTIEVHSVGVVGINDNLYAISYRQSTADSHTFNIQNNTAFTDGFYAVYLLSSDKSTIINNVLISYNPNAVSGSDSYGRGSGEHNQDTAYNNRVFTIMDYLNSRNNINVNPESNSDISNNINFNNNNQNSQSGSNSNNQQNSRTNPLIPAYTDNKGNTDKSGSDGISGIVDNYQDDGSVQGTIGDYSGVQTTYNHNSDKTDVVDENNEEKSVVESKNINTTDVKGSSSNAIVNNSESTPSVGQDTGNPLTKSQSSASSSDSQSVSKKAFEIDEMKESEEFIPSIFFIVAALILLIVGYKRKNTDLY